VVASHDLNVHEAADLIFGLQDGRLVEREALRGEDLFEPPEEEGGVVDGVRDRRFRNNDLDFTRAVTAGKPLSIQN